MSTADLKIDLIKSISTIDDVFILEEIKRLIKINDIQDDLYVFSDEQRKTILNSLKQYKDGNVMTSKEAEEDIKKWIE